MTASAIKSTRTGAAIGTGSEVLSHFAGLVGHGISAGMFLGLTRTPDYAYLQSRDLVEFRSAHPDTVIRGFTVLNIPTEINHFWYRRPPGDELIPFFGDGAVVEFPSSTQPLSKYHRKVESSYSWVEPKSLDRTQLLSNTVFQEVSEQGTSPEAADTVPARLSFYVPHLNKTSWSRRASIQLALHQHMQQSSQTRVGSVWVGVSAINQLAFHLEVQSESRTWTQLFVGASHHEVACHRDLLADFLFEASEELGNDRLRDCAIRYQEIGYCWRDLHQQINKLSAWNAAQKIRSISAYESLSLNSMRRSLSR